MWRSWSFLTYFNNWFVRIVSCNSPLTSHANWDANSFHSFDYFIYSYFFFSYQLSAEYRHQQFRQNLTHDYDMVNTPQDNKELIWFVREVLMKKYPMPNLQRLPLDEFNYNSSNEQAPKMSKFIGENLFGSKKSGFYFQSLTGSNADMMPAPWLTESLGWGGCIVEPDPRKYFSYRKLYAQRDSTKIIHASLSPQKYPKEVRQCSL